MGLPLAGAHVAGSSFPIPDGRDPVESSAPVSEGASPTRRATRPAPPEPPTTAPHPRARTDYADPDNHGADLAG